MNDNNDIAADAEQSKSIVEKEKAHSNHASLSNVLEEGSESISDYCVDGEGGRSLSSFEEDEERNPMNSFLSKANSIEENIFSWLYRETTSQENRAPENSFKRRLNEEMNPPEPSKQFCSGGLSTIRPNGAESIKATPTTSCNDSLSLSDHSSHSHKSSQDLGPPPLSDMSMPPEHACRPTYSSNNSQRLFSHVFDKWIACTVDDTRDQTQPRQTILELVGRDSDSNPQLWTHGGTNEDIARSATVPFSFSLADSNNNATIVYSITDENRPTTRDAFFPILEKKRVVFERNIASHYEYENFSESNFVLNSKSQLRAFWPNQQGFLPQLTRNLSSFSVEQHPQSDEDASSEVYPRSGITPEDLSSYSKLLQTRTSNFKCAASLNLLTYDDYVQRLPSNILPSDTFCLVPGRLGMPNQCKTHEVTVGEMLRRVLKPETLNISLLGPILRKAKSKHGSQHLRQRLQQIGVELPVGRRKTAQCSLFTSLTESEAEQLADDYRNLCVCSFPTRQLASRAAQNFNSVSTVDRNLENFCKDIIALVDFYIDSCVQPSYHQQAYGDESDDLAQKLSDFNALTHGFGIHALTSSLRTFRLFIEILSEQPSSGEEMLSEQPPSGED